MTSSLSLLLSACLLATTPETEHYDPRPGDLILFQSPGVLRNVVYAIGCSPGVTHAGIVVARPDGSLGMLEAPGNGYPVMVSDLPTRRQYSKGRVWFRARKTPLSPVQSKCMTDFACRQEGKPFFSVGVLIPSFGKPIPRCFRKCVKPEDLEPSKWFCAPLCIGAMITAGLLDPCTTKPWYVDPQDLKSDTWLDLSCGWEKPVRWLYCGERRECWMSVSCCGPPESRVQWWK